MENVLMMQTLTGVYSTDQDMLNIYTRKGTGLDGHEVGKYRRQPVAASHFSAHKLGVIIGTLIVSNYARVQAFRMLSLASGLLQIGKY